MTCLLLRARALLVLVPASLVGCSGPEAEPTPANLTLAHGRFVWSGSPLPAGSAERTFTARELAGWSPPADAAVEGEALVWSGPASLRSPADLELAAHLLDRALVVVEGGHPRYTAFDLRWSAAESGTENAAAAGYPLRYPEPGRQELSLDLVGWPGWSGTVRGLEYAPLGQGAGARTRLERIHLEGPFVDLTRSVAAPGEVHLAGEFRAGLRAVVPATGSLTLRCPPDARLHLGLGVVGDARRSGTVRLAVAVRSGDVVTELLSETPPVGVAWLDRQVDLSPFGGRAIELLLLAEGPPGSVAVFAEPVLRAASDPRPPDVFVYLTDTLRRDALGLHGGPAQDTPALERLARSSVVFEDALAPSDWTRPSVVSLMTSTHVSTHGIPHHVRRLGPEFPTLAGRLRARGYRTACFTTNGLAAHASGLERGFSVVHDTTRRPGGDRVRSLPPRALEWIAAQGDEPLFVYVHTAEPHDPYEPPAEHRSDSGYRGPVDGSNFVRLADTPAEVEHVRSLYAGEVRHADQALGGFLEGLERLGRLDPSWFVFTSDHGEAFLEHGRWKHRAGLYAHQLEVPLVVRRPHGAGGGERRGEPVSLVDVAPTLLAGVDAPHPGGLEGRDLFGDTPSRSRGVLSESSTGGDGKEVRIDCALTTERWRVVLESDASGGPDVVRVHDRRADAEEERPLAPPWPPEVVELVARLTRRRDEALARSAGRGAGSGPVDLGYLGTLRGLGYLEDDE